MISSGLNESGFIVLFTFTGCSPSIDNSSNPVTTTISPASTNPDNSDMNAGSITVPSIPSAGVENETSQNTSYHSKQEFLDSSEGHSFQITAYKFAKAFFENNERVIKSYLIDPDKGFHKNDQNYDFANVEFMILKLDSKDIKKDSVSAQYEFKLDSEDSYTYLQLSMKKENDQWKIESYGLEK